MRTAAQTAVFWLVFVVVGPLGLNAIDPWQSQGHVALGLGLGVLFGALNLWSGWTMATVGRGTPFPTQTARALVVRGPYRFVRNPMALGGLGVGFAMGVALGSPLTMTYAVLGGVVWHLVARPMEERDLLARFGQDYEAYRRAVRCWWPRWRGFDA